jgi:hypothetical protein
MSQLGFIPCVLFLLYATAQDIRHHHVERYVFVLWVTVAVIGGLVGAWPLSMIGAVVGYVLLSLAGVLSGDKLGGALVGALIGPIVAFAVALALVLAWLTWRRWGPWRSPADFAFYPFLSAGTAGIIGYQIITGCLSGA